MAEEKILQSKILRDLDSKGKNCIAFKIEKASVNGVPDIFFSTPSTGPVFVETKSKKNKVSPIQAEVHKNLIYCGAKVYVCHTWGQWVELKKMLNMN